jgi:hypothetical protein
MNSDFICSKTPLDAAKCDKAKSDLDLKNKECSVKTRKYIFLLGGLCIPFAIFIIWYSRWWNKKTHENPGYAQLGAMTMEAGLLSQVFNGRR